MKKVVDSAKGATASSVKTAPPKKSAQAPAVTPSPTTLQPAVTADDSLDAPVIIFPEWSDAEVAAEKWSTKHTFEDPDGLVPLPPSLRAMLPVNASQPGYVQKRHIDILGDGSNPIGIAAPAAIEDSFYASNSSAPQTPQSLSEKKNKTAGAESLDSETIQTTKSESQPNLENAIHSPSDDAENPQTSNIVPHNGAGADMSSGMDGQIAAISCPNIDEDQNISVTAGTSPLEQEVTSKFFDQNRHIICSELMRQIIATFHFLYDQSKISRASNIADEFAPWENLYPKSKDGLPMYNASGRYAVKLFWLGCWRKVIVDDRIPVDDLNRPLLVFSPTAQEIWPVLITKAILKVASASYRYTSLSVPITNNISLAKMRSTCEHGDFDVFHCLKGWLPERIKLYDREERINALWNVLNDMNLRNPQSFPNPPKPTIWGSTPASGAASTTTAKGVPASTVPSTIVNAGATATIERISSPSGKSGPYTIVLAYRDGESPESSEKADLATIPFPFRICDVKDGSTGVQQSQVYMKSYFSLCRPKKYSISGSKDSGAENTVLDDMANFSLSLHEFVKTYRYIMIYHNQGSFKIAKSVQNIVDMTKPIDATRIPPLLYLPDTTKEATIFCVLSTFGRTKVDGPNQMSSVMLEPYDWKFDPKADCTEKKPVIRLTTNSTLATLFKLPAGALQFTVDCTTSYNLSFWSRDDFLLEDEAKYLSERLSLAVRDIDETFPAQSAGSWFVLFKNQIRFSEPVYLAASLYVPDSLQLCASLRMFDNDTRKELPHIFHNLKSGYFLPNNASKWKLRLISEPTPIYPLDKIPPEMSVKPNVQDFEDLFVPNKHNILFRYVAKVKDAPENWASMQVTFSFPQAMLKLQVFDNDVEIASASGKGTAVLHAVQLVQVLEDVAVPATSASGKTEKKDKEKEAAEKRDKEERERMAKENIPAAGKHRYVIQATVEQLELLKPASPGLLNAADGGRPSSRGGGKLPSSASPAKAKKKLSAGAGIHPIIADAAAANMALDPIWKLRIVSTDAATLAIVKDTEKEDRYKMIKDSWEANQTGRCAKAREARDAYLKQVEAGSVKPVAILLTAGIDDNESSAATLGKPKITPIVAKASDVVYKPWTLIKESGIGGRRLDSFDKPVNLFGMNGERVIFDFSKLASAGDTGASNGVVFGRSPSIVDEITLDGSPSLSLLNKPGTAGSEFSSGISASKQSSAKPGANFEATMSSFNHPDSDADAEVLDSVMSQPAWDNEISQIVPSKDEVSQNTSRPLTQASEFDDESGSCPSTIEQLQAYLKDRAPYMERSQLFRTGARMGTKPPSPGDAFAFKLPAVMLPGGFTKPLDFNVNPGKAVDSCVQQLTTEVQRTTSERLDFTTRQMNEFDSECAKTEPLKRNASVMLSTLRGHVQNDAEKEERLRRRTERLQEHLSFHNQVVKERLSDKEYRSRVKQYVAEKIEEILLDIEAEKSEDAQRRELYRARVAKEYEDASRRKLEAELQRQAELANAEGAEDQAVAAAGNNSKAKKGKK
ncbi:hypothetical protein HDU84_007759 [Entophlyctis sp. JEL0112]|nr:hypothetical protein HDU84_007759 [Entophlyctis sp. JEL0112]